MASIVKSFSGSAIPNDGDARAIESQAALFETLQSQLWASPDADILVPFARSPAELSAAPTMSLDPINDAALHLFRAWEPQDQGNYRSTCVAFSVLAMIELHEHLRGNQPSVANYSEEFLYYKMRNEHEPEDQPANYASGSTFMQQGANALESSGVCLDATMPYRAEITEPDYTEMPKPGALDEAKGRKFGPGSFYYARLYKKALDAWRKMDLVTTFRQALKHGCPISAAFPLYVGDDQWSHYLSNGWRFGYVTDPNPTNRPNIVDIIKENDIGSVINGGHAVCIVGYQNGEDGAEGRFLFRNSWGDRFAGKFDDERLPMNAPRRGYGTVSAAHVQNHCWEFMFQKP